MNYINIITDPQPNAKTVIRYNRKAGWKTVNGLVTSHGPGPDGRRAAEWAALAADWPALYIEAQALAIGEGEGAGHVRRILKGARLLLEGHVYDGEVRSQSDPHKFYRIRFEGTPRRYECGCEDYQSGRAPWAARMCGRVCKHGRAAHLAWLLGLTLGAPPIPFMGEAIVIEDIWDGGTGPDEPIDEEIDIDAYMGEPVRPQWYYAPVIDQMMADNGLTRDEAAQMFRERD